MLIFVSRVFIIIVVRMVFVEIKKINKINFRIIIIVIFMNCFLMSNGFIFLKIINYEG